jgi:hypothetical protein
VDTDNNNKYTGPERRVADRRVMADRRSTTRFSDVLGRRSGVDRRLPERIDSESTKPERAN